MLTGKHLIAGQWSASEQTFLAITHSEKPLAISIASASEVDEAVAAADAVFMSYSATSREVRAELLNTIADEIDSRGQTITQIGMAETSLPEARLNGERGRTVGQLRMFAKHILKGEYLDKKHDPAMPDREPLSRSDLKMIQRPIGPVAVFGASNFPLAFSTAGGDTASALAAGCPVVVKGHPAHPGTSEIIAQAILASLTKLNLPLGIFSLLQGNINDVGSALVCHPLIEAVGFTGSQKAGRALFNLCAKRERPIPFFGELGSINPVFLLPTAVKDRHDAIAEGWAGSLIMGAGQFCTNPGVVIGIASPEFDAFKSTTKQRLENASAQTMLTEEIAQAYRHGRDQVAQQATALITSHNQGREITADLFCVSATEWLASADLAEEVFGPLGIIVEAKNLDEIMQVAQKLEGQLTCTLQMDPADKEVAKKLLPILERKAGRILANGFPTGVEVCDAMVHGGPYPASTNFGATSVGTLAIRRFVRPVCYQDIPDDLLPADLV